jgi:ATP-dependent Lon protease
LSSIINNYCGHEAGVRNLRKCLDRVFRKIVAKLENKKIEDLDLHVKANGEESASTEALLENKETTPTVYKGELPERVMKEY